MVVPFERSNRALKRRLHRFVTIPKRVLQSGQRFWIGDAPQADSGSLTYPPVRVLERSAQRVHGRESSVEAQGSSGVHAHAPVRIAQSCQQRLEGAIVPVVT